MTKLSKLKSLDLSNCHQMTEIGAQAILERINLTNLSMCGAILVSEATIIRLIETLTDLEKLDLSACNITDATLHAIMHHSKSLKTIALIACPDITEDGLMLLFDTVPDLEITLE